MKTKKVVVLLLAASTSFFAVAQVSAPLEVAVPFPFYVGNKMLPAGSYKIQTNADLLLVTVSSDNGKDNATAVLITQISTSAEDRNSVVFDVVGNTHYLSEIYLQGEEGLQVKASAESHSHVRIKGKQ